MMESQSRSMTAEERALMRRLLSTEFAGRNELLEQLEHVRVKTLDVDGGLEFDVDPSSPRADAVKYRVPTEGTCEDLDGIVIHVLLHVVNGQLKELEIYKEDNSRVKNPPDSSTLRLLAEQ